MKDVVLGFFDFKITFSKKLIIMRRIQLTQLLTRLRRLQQMYKPVVRL